MLAKKKGRKSGLGFALQNRETRLWLSQLMTN
jgi:hypothetical protein